MQRRPGSMCLRAFCVRAADEADSAGQKHCSSSHVTLTHTRHSVRRCVIGWPQPVYRKAYLYAAAPRHCAGPLQFEGKQVFNTWQLLWGPHLHIDGHVALCLQLHGQALLLQARLQARQNCRHLPRALRQVAPQLARAGLHACTTPEGLMHVGSSDESPGRKPSVQVRLSARRVCRRLADTQGSQPLSLSAEAVRQGPP